MRLAILMSNTDESAFAQTHPKDGDKWQALLSPLCPDCTFSVYSVKDREFPVDETEYDGWIITGSPASVHDLDPWLEQLFALIRRIVARKTPLFGACFGHQAIALALGGAVAPNPNGWVFGSTETHVHAPAPWMHPGPLRQYAAHVEQVTQLPNGATITMENADCPIGGFVIGDHVFTTQYHPEMSTDFIAALIEELADQKPPEVIAHARASLPSGADNQRFAGWIMDFLRRA
ncbi:type 1 glutamine amidotransferase [Aliiroseovarius subalbicans]|uniref:type 1 glutamine amidotransferase n=1 Tax=Aliiroseovarius subalbicans TaxID=2925840 RepID=UPI001F594D73|nr:type 1 glutamine amidotransferase [Aliiroseovarius subalbicans]MCI2397830.1 type 1 glutamine amidotransferase [Aliiroseovarius subalbicans]